MKNVKFNSEDVFYITDEMFKDNREIRGIFCKDLKELHDILNEDNEVIKSKIMSLNKESMIKLGFKIFYQCTEVDFFDEFDVKIKKIYKDSIEQKKQYVEQLKDLEFDRDFKSVYVDLLKSTMFNKKEIDKILQSYKDEKKDFKIEIPKSKDEMMLTYYKYRIDLKDIALNIRSLKDKIKDLDKIQGEMLKYIRG